MPLIAAHLTGYYSAFLLRRDAAAAERAAKPVPNNTTVIGSGISAGGTGVGGGVTVCGGWSVSVGPGVGVAVGGSGVGVAVGGSGVGVAVGGGWVGRLVGVSAASGAASTEGTATTPDMIANERSRSTEAMIYK